MDQLNFSENLIRLRRGKKVTQEALADFIGVTKASVSKWETRQSLPDILLLPQLASFFGVSVDELLGYAPQLGREQIQKLYHELAGNFAADPFDGVMEKCRELIKKYYSCYPFLFQMCVLYLNHFMLAEGQEKQKKILQECLHLSDHILKECSDIPICNDTLVLRANIQLLLGQVQEVIETLEESTNPYRLSGQSDSLLIQAYQIAGKKEKAINHAQISMYLHLMSLMSGAVWYLELCKDNLPVCEETIRQLDALSGLYHLEQINSNTAALFYLQSAVVYCLHQKETEALERLESYVSVIQWMMADDHLIAHEDGYFDRISSWYEGCDLGMEAPREKRIILASAVQGLEHPAFVNLKENPKYQRLQKLLKEVTI